MTVTETGIPGLVVFEPRVFSDDRGFFLETWRENIFQELGIPAFVQDNQSRSLKGVLRGLHYQHPDGQGKLVRVVRGAVFDVAVDIRAGSDTFGKWFGLEMNDENQKMLYVPPGFAHGFLVLSDQADFLYRCTTYYSPQNEGGIRWDDPDIGIAWPGDGSITISDRDASLPFLRDISDEKLPV